MSVLLPPQLQSLPASLPVEGAVNIVMEDGIPIKTFKGRCKLEVPYNHAECGCRGWLLKIPADAIIPKA